MILYMYKAECQSEFCDTLYGWLNIKVLYVLFYGVYSDSLVRQNPLTIKGFNLRLLSIYRQFTFVMDSINYQPLFSGNECFDF